MDHIPSSCLSVRVKTFQVPSGRGLPTVPVILSAERMKDTSTEVILSYDKRIHALLSQKRSRSGPAMTTIVQPVPKAVWCMGARTSSSRERGPDLSQRILKVSVRSAGGKTITQTW